MRWIIVAYAHAPVSRVLRRITRQSQQVQRDWPADAALKRVPGECAINEQRGRLRAGAAVRSAESVDGQARPCRCRPPAW